MRDSELMVCFFKQENWENLIDKAELKNLDKKLIRELCKPNARQALYNKIKEGKYVIFPPSVSLIPKDTPGEYREVYINQDIDRIVLSELNDCLFLLFPDMVHEKCKSYQKGIGTQEVVQTISKEIVSLGVKQNHIGYKYDFSKYFDRVRIEHIDKVFDIIEDRLGFERGTEPLVNILRQYYHQDIYFDNKGKVCHRYQSLKQGCSVASFLADVILYELDEYMSNKYKIYYRYSDDLIVIDENTSSATDEINSIVNKYGVSLNPKKVQPLYNDQWFKFLGFLLKENMITISGSRLSKFQTEIEKRTIRRKNMNAKKAKRNVLHYLYDGKFCWATSCLGTINVEADLIEMDNFIKDCIRACETGKKHLGGLGCCLDRGSKTVFRGRGRNVKKNKEVTDKIIGNYYSLNCMSNAIKMSKTIFNSLVNEMR